MKKKNGFNIMLFVFMAILIIIFSCTKKNGKKMTGTLLQTDREFSEMSRKEGMFVAFLAYIAEDGVILRDNSYPEQGKEKLQSRFDGRSDTSFVLTWEPLFEKIAESGEIGYTYGTHTNLDKASGTVTKGTYVTIWLKQPDGSWKYILDSGTQGLPEK
jgi:ketosteroid isomerase-like protein